MKKQLLGSIICLLVSLVSASAAVNSGNLLVNPGAENANLSGWVEFTGNIEAVTFQVQSSSSHPVSPSDVYPASGDYFFSMADAQAVFHPLLIPDQGAAFTQTIDLTGFAATPNEFNANGWIQTELWQEGVEPNNYDSNITANDYGRLLISFLDENDFLVDEIISEPIGHPVLGTDSYAPFSLTGSIPDGTAKIMYTPLGILVEGTFANVFYDDLEFTVGLRASIDKTMQSEAGLGDHVTITLQVNNPYDPNIIVEDILPDGLKYITGTLTDNGQPAIPVITENGIKFEVNQGEHTIVFDVQVVQVSDANEIRINEAVVYDDTGVKDANDTAEIILQPYEGFSKVVVDFNNLGDYDGPVDVNEFQVPIGNDVHWWISILVENIAGDEIVDMNDIIVTDRLGGDLEADSYEVYQGDVTLFDYTRKGKQKGGNTEKQHITWTVGDVADANDAELILEISTDINTGHGNKKKDSGHQEYTSEGWHTLNSGAVLKFTDPITGFRLSAHTPEIRVWAFPVE